MRFRVSQLWPDRSKPFRIAICAALWLAIAFAWFTARSQPPILHHARAAVPADEFELTDPDERSPGEPQLANAARAPRKHDTFAHWALDVEAEADYVSPPKYKLLDDLIDAVKQRITYDPTIKEPRRQRRQAVRILRAIDQVLTEHNVLYPPGEYDTTSLRLGLSPQRFDQPTLRKVLRVSLNSRRFDHALANADQPFFILDCDTASIVYLGIADACGFGDRLHLVDLPDHMFVRWVFTDGSHLNWDTNDASVADDDDYAADYELTRTLRRRRIYLSSMTRDEAKGHVYFLRAGAHENRGRLDKAIADMERVVQLVPQSTQARSDLAWLYATTRDLPGEKRQKALSLAQSAIDLEPRCGDFWDTLAAAHAATGDFKQATACADRAVEFALTKEDRGEYRSRRREYEKGRLPSFND